MFPKKLDEIPLEERIYCNRSLKMPRIKAVGFDMDYTLCIYKQEMFEALAYDETVKKLVESKGYPKELLKWTYDPKYMIRGLVIDKKRGNILKIDRHRYVKVAYHGFRELTREERQEFYDVEKSTVYEEPDYALLDTIFSLPEAYLIVQLVDFKERTGKLKNKTFSDFYYDIRTSIDLSHRDGTIKNKVMKHPERYINKDIYLAETLQSLREAGRKLFILTNSLWEYTNSIMSYLLPPNSKLDKKNWMDYFDVIITAAQKPSFFMERHALYQVNTENGLLQNVGALEAPQIHDNVKVYQGGHVILLHQLLGIKRGSEILYVGDHIYGDILRSKKEIGWRTMLIVEELEHEVKTLRKMKHEYEICHSLNQKKERLEDELDRYIHAYEAYKHGRKMISIFETMNAEEFQTKIKKLKYDISKVKELEKKEIQKYHESFHPVWGSLLKTSRQNSRFSAQIENYACLYTCKFTNIRHYGVNKSFRATPDTMPHDLNV